MKRIMLALLCLALLGQPIPEAGAQAVPPSILMMDAVLDSGLRLQSIAAVDGTLYIKAHDGVYRWRSGEAEASRVLDTPLPWLAKEGDLQFHQLLGEGAQLYGLNTLSGALHPLADQGDSLVAGPAIQLDWSRFAAGGEVDAPRSLFLQGGLIWGLQAADGQPISLNPADGSLTQHRSQQPLLALAPCGQQGLLAIPREGGEQAWRLNPDTGELTQPMPVPGAAWDSQAASLTCSADDSQVYWLSQHAAFRQGPEQLQALIGSVTGFDSPRYGSSSALVMAQEGLLAALTSSGVCLILVNAQPMSKVKLVVYAREDYAHMKAASKAAARLPGIEVEVRPVAAFGSYSIDQEQLMQLMLSRDDSADIYLVDSLGNNVRALIEKGYAAGISGQAACAAAVGGLYPQLQALVRHQEGIYALPIDLTAELHTGSPASFARIGRPVPQDFFALCELYEAWAGGLHEQHADTLLGLQSKGMLKQIGYQLYVDQALAQGQALQFDSELFRRMMARVEQIDSRRYEKGLSDNPHFIHLLYQGVANLHPALFHQVKGHENNAPLPLGAEAASPAALRSRVTALIINPYSRHPEEAQAYLSAMAQGMPWDIRVLMMPGEAMDGIEDPAYEEKLATARENIERMQAQLKGGQNVHLLESLIAAEQQRVQDAEVSLRYLLTADERQEIHQLMQAAYVPDSYQQTVLSAGVEDQFQIYLEGSQTLDQFIREADKRLRLIGLEQR